MNLVHLTPQPFRLARIFGVKLAPVIEQAQLLIDARSDGGVVAVGIAALLEDMLPIIEPPSGYLGDLIAELGELRGRDGDVVFITKGAAFVGPMPDLLAAARYTVVSTCEKYAASGYGPEAARERQAMERGRPALRAVV